MTISHLLGAPTAQIMQLMFESEISVIEFIVLFIYDSEVLNNFDLLSLLVLLLVVE